MTTLLLTLLILMTPIQSERWACMVGVPGLKVIVAALNDDAKATGLTEDQIKTDVELKLRLAGITLGNDFSPSLYVMVTYLKEQAGEVTLGYASFVDLSLHQNVTVFANDRLVYATTWKNGALLSGTVGLARERIRTTIEDFTNKFINDYLAANPKK